MRPVVWLGATFRFVSSDSKAMLPAKLIEPGRMTEFLKTMKTNGADAEAQLPNVQCG